MFIRRSIQSLAVVAVAFAATTTSATTPPPPPAPTLHDGRYYEVVIANSISWEAARTAAEQRTYQGVQGHLATIGSPEEDSFVHGLRQQRLSQPHPTLTGTELWVGGYQVPCATGTPEPACGWLWINGEPIAPTNVGSPYTNWQNNEPNNIVRVPGTYARASEDHLAIGNNGAFGWNDEGLLTNVWGYVVEYGDKVVVPATSCTAENGGCNPTGSQLLTYPATAKVAEDASLTARWWRFHDDPNRCGVAPLPLFDGAVVIPPYLCGHPDFVVIETDASGVEVPSGAIEVENLTEDVLPGNLYGCSAIRQNPVGVIDPDPSHRDVVAWQSSDADDMLETLLGTGRYFGTLTEVTYGCGSSRGKVVEGSFHFVGLQIHAGSGNEYATNPAGNHQSFIELIRYKLTVLQKSVAAVKDTLPGASYVALRSHVKNAIQSHDRGDYATALQHIQRFLKEVGLSKYRPVAGENPSGEHLMRGSNIQFMYTDKLIPYAL